MRTKGTEEEAKVAAEYYQQLWEVYAAKGASLTVAYRRLREILEHLCRTLMPDSNLQMTDSAAKITWLSNKYDLSNADENSLHAFRINSNQLLNRRKEPDEESFLIDLRTLAFAVRSFFGQDIPLPLYSVLPKYRVAYPAAESSNPTLLKRIRVCFRYAEDELFYATPLDTLSDTLLKVRWGVKGVNDAFNQTVNNLWQYAQVNLLDVTVDEEGVYTPAFIVLEPDYLIDISSLAECFKPYGSHPDNYIIGRLSPSENTAPLLLGNLTNLFLDEWIHAEDEVDYIECMQKAFKVYAIEIASCADLWDKEKEREFFANCRKHFLHIRQVVKETFANPGYELDREDAVLEPSYICEALGVQGRLDYMQRDMSRFVEMKSGKADEYAIRGKVLPKENHQVQMLLYMAVLEYNMSVDHRKQHPFLLYTLYPILYPARTSWAVVKRAINLRNLIVCGEYGVQLRNSADYTLRRLRQIVPNRLNEKGIEGVLWRRYLYPSICAFGERINEMSELEQLYYATLYNFIVKEQYLSKSGDVEYDRRSGSSALWLSTFAEKCEAGELLYDLQLVDNHASDEHKASVSFAIPAYDDDVLPNFRKGDVVVLYERNTDMDNVTNKMVFKGSIEDITPCGVKVRIRARQRNRSVLPVDSRYAIEHDTMDTTFRSMFQGLYAFSTANRDRRALLLSQRKPRFDEDYVGQIASADDDFERVALKAVAAQDYFLLVGPPGTGKTSRALKRMVEMMLLKPGSQLLLLAYTNRAVDEICKSVCSITPEVDFIRIGSELSCEEPYRKYLLENVLADCTKRLEVVRRIEACSLFVGTVASLGNKQELFRLKHFDAVIVDEATQILEPQLLGILCAKDSSGLNAVDKFILIGDHKQLPAVVLQSRQQTHVCDEDLQRIGVTNLSDSLFERLYKCHLGETDSMAVDMLHKQGRMNPEVALFPNNAFYEGRLKPVGLPHQQGELQLWAGKDMIKGDWLKLLNSRIAFIPSVVCKAGNSWKVNLSEAQLVSEIAFRIYERDKEAFDPAKKIGIITPYRSQVAMIKKELSGKGIPMLNEITVDTVERYQGSERDVIIYSLSVNHPWQLKNLVNVINENGYPIDRKLNVALTRAREQLFVTGVAEVLECDPIYAELLKLMKSIDGFINLCKS